MSNLIDYLHWRGDLNFSVSPFNELDAAIFAMLSYVNMAGVVPGLDSKSRILISDAMKGILANYYPGAEKPNENADIVASFNEKFSSDLEEAFRLVASSPRYAGIYLSGFEKHTDFAEGQQFAALTFTLPGLRPTQVVAFRGTDNTFVGWKEDFGLAYMEQLPAQESALNYLTQSLKKLPGPFIVCGHSKGGNLAVYASSHLETRDRERITRIINFDGPGFDFKLNDKAPFELCQDKIVNFVPEESTIGMLLNPVGERQVVSSLSHSVRQHNVFLWNVERTGFTPAELADSSKMLDTILDTWVDELSLEERKKFFEAIFDMLGDVDETVIPKDPLNNLTYITNTLVKYNQLDKETKTLINLVFGALTNQTRETLTTAIQQRIPGRKKAS